MALLPWKQAGASLRASNVLARLTGALLVVGAAVSALPIQAETASRVVWQGRWGYNDQSPEASSGPWHR